MRGSASKRSIPTDIVQGVSPREIIIFSKQNSNHQVHLKQRFVVNDFRFLFYCLNTTFSEFGACRQKESSFVTFFSLWTFRGSHLCCCCRRTQGSMIYWLVVVGIFFSIGRYLYGRVFLGEARLSVSRLLSNGDIENQNVNTTEQTQLSQFSATPDANTAICVVFRCGSLRKLSKTQSIKPTRPFERLRIHIGFGYSR